MVSATMKIDAGDAFKFLSMINRHVSVIGASRGIGEAVARRLAMDEGIRKRLKSTHALRRFPKPDEIAEVIEFLLGPSRSVITGQAIDVSCGAIR